MARADLPQNLIEALQEVGMSPVMDQGAVWNCRGTPVVYHKALERIAHKKNMRFDPPMIIETDAEKNIAVVCVTGYFGDFSEWSIGESTPRNTTNNYPFAMAEKRAKDRVILKLLGVAGFVYSEAEADNFEKSNPELVSKKNDDTGFNPEEQKARKFLRDVDMRCSPANMKTPNDLIKLVENSWFRDGKKHAKEHSEFVTGKLKETIEQAARRLKVEMN
tara:strand:+ start:35 stop:691 length:657 start_codon:yes stop_codon:yes gene_type:complete